MNKRNVVYISVLAGILALAQPGRAENAAAAPAEPLYATVNDKTITQKDYQTAFANYARQKFYHGQVSEDRVAEARKEVGEQLIDRILLLDEAKRRGLVADEKAIAQTIAGYEARYGGSEMWQKGRERMLPAVRKQLTEQDLIGQIEAIGQATSEPTDEAVLDYYKAQPDLFTEPEKLHLHTILLKVDPSAPGTAWDAAREEAGKLVARLKAGGAKFEDLASLHSQDRSADQGGDMGYVHRGMIPEQVQKVLDERQIGDVGDPIDVLEGIAIFRLDERIPPRLMPFADVAGRARELLKRDRTKQAWEDFRAGLRKAGSIQVVTPTPAPATTKN